MLIILCGEVKILPRRVGLLRHLLLKTIFACLTTVLTLFSTLVMVPILQLTYLWQVPIFSIDFLGRFHDDCCGSDHFPIVLRTLEDDNHIKPQRWKFKQADWLTFKALCSLQLNKDTFESEDPVVDFSTTLLEIADKTIPKSSISSKPRKPWFDSECKQVIKHRKKAEKLFRRSPCPFEIIV